MSAQRPLHFVTLLGSLRKASYHGALAEALVAIAPSGVTIQGLGSVGALPFYDADILAEGLPVKVMEMGEAITKADGVIILTPEYSYSVPGVLKNALDWLSRLPSQPFAAKPTLIQTGSPGSVGGARAQHHLRQILVFLDAYAMNKPEVMITHIMNKVDPIANTITDAATRTLVTGQLAAFAAFVRRLG
jgi:chromate reductase